jgi:hypothetical protein
MRTQNLKYTFSGFPAKKAEMKKHYDQWDCKAALYSALQALSLVDQALTLMADPRSHHGIWTRAV